MKCFWPFEQVKHVCTIFPPSRSQAIFKVLGYISRIIAFRLFEQSTEHISTATEMIKPKHKAKSFIVLILVMLIRYELWTVGGWDILQGTFTSYIWDWPFWFNFAFCLNPLFWANRRIGLPKWELISLVRPLQVYTLFGILL